MSEGCKACEHAEDLKGCASKHASEALKMLSEGNIEGAKKNLESFEKHLKE